MADGRYHERYTFVEDTTVALRAELLNTRDITEMDRNERAVIAGKLATLSEVAKASSDILKLVDG